MAKSAPKTAIANALAAAGYTPPRDRLNAVADRIMAGTFRTRAAMVQEVVRQIIGDAELLWCLFEPFANTAIGRLLEDAVARRAQQTSSSSSGAMEDANTSGSAPQSAGSGGMAAAAGITPIATAPGITAAQRRRAQTENAKSIVAGVISKLDTFRINGRPIGDCTPEEISAWGAARKRDARFAWLLANAGVPAGHRVRDYLKPEEANALYDRAVAETGNE